VRELTPKQRIGVRQSGVTVRQNELRRAQIRVANNPTPKRLKELESAEKALRFARESLVEEEARQADETA